MSGLAGLADAIESGVARAPGPGFQKNIQQERELQKQNLAAALQAKYKGQELQQGLAKIGQEGQRIENERAYQKGELANQSAERQQRGQQIGLEGAKAKVEAAQKVVEAYEKGAGWFGAKLGQERPTDAEYRAAKAILTGSGGGAAQGATQSKIIHGQMYHQIGGKWYKE
jgi:hypothetical protein